jgi:tRNA (guanine-N7-)-methyltransferase
LVSHCVSKIPPVRARPSAVGVLIDSELPEEDRSGAVARMQLGIFSPSQEIGRDYWLAAGSFDRVELEIGPGNCGFLRSAALAAPRTLHVGIEWQPSLVVRALRSGPLPPNLRLIEGDGAWIVRHLLAPASIDAIHVYFPDPWWKKRHHKRRLFQSELCATLAEVLVPGGGVYVVTDVVPLFTEIRERMEAAGFRTEPWERTDTGSSSYESKYRKQGRRFEKARFMKPENRDRPGF